MHVSVHLLPTLAPLDRLAGQCVAVIDVLRATTTILAALDSGATAVIPCRTVREARQFGRQGMLMGGERGGKKIRGFDLGNSPGEYTPSAVAGRLIATTTTNGTRALLRCRGAQQVILAAFTNRSAVVGRLLPWPEVHLICAGTDGVVTLEDSLLAGCLLEELGRRSPAIQTNDAGFLCQATWQQAGSGEMHPEVLYQQFCRSQGGLNLIRQALQSDLRFAATMDRSSHVPVYDPRTGRIELG